MDKKKILIIDDDESLVELIRMNLETTGNYEVRTDTKGTFGLGDMFSFRPDLILLDIVMYDMPGAEVLKYAFDHGFPKDIPIIFITGVLKMGQGIVKDIYVGYPVLYKPISTRDLIAAIEKSLKNKK